MLTYDEFKDKVKSSILDYLPDSSNYHVDIITAVKNNDLILDGLSIKNPNVNIAPTIYLNSFYDINYKNGATLEECLQEIAQIYKEHSLSQDIDTGIFMQWDTVKDRIICKLVCGENNEEYLKDKPHKNMSNIAIVYSIIVDIFKDETTSSILTNSLFDLYGISLDDLHEVALKNTEKLYPCVLNDIFSILELDLYNGQPINYLEPQNMELTLPENSELYVLTNTKKINGASVMLYPGVLDMIGNKIGGDFYILPSSIHEVLILPKTENSKLEELEKMVADINDTEVAQDEILSYHVFEYDTKEHVLFCGNKDNILLKYNNTIEPKESIDNLITAAKTVKHTDSKNNKNRINNSAEKYSFSF